MTTITKYRALDNSEWGTKKDCQFRDDLIDQVKSIMSELPKEPTELNWQGYVQHNVESILKCKADLYGLANKQGVLKHWIDNQKELHKKTDYDLMTSAHPSWFNRMLDGSHTPLSKAYVRLCCIDDDLREFNQPYFVDYPEEAELFQRN